MQIFNSLDKTIIILTPEDISLKDNMELNADILLVPVSIKWTAFVSNLILATCGRKGEIIYYIDKK